MESALQIAERLEKEGRRTLEFFRQIAPEQWGVQVYADGAAWNVRQVFAHITEVEDSIPRLIQSILDGGPGVSEDFDLDRYNAGAVGKMDDLTPADLFELFAARRANTVEQVRNFSEVELDVIGRHPFLGIAAIREMLRVMIINEKSHYRDVQRVLKAA
jgi:hypothetical protein